MLYCSLIILRGRTSGIEQTCYILVPQVRGEASKCHQEHWRQQLHSCRIRIMDRYDIRKYIKPALPAQKPSGILDATSDWRDVTPAIGREYASLNLKDILASDELVKELALIGLRF